MAAYAALVSLSQTTNLLLNSNKYSISVDGRAKITSIREYVMLLISFLEDSPEKSISLEGKIRDVASETEVIIEDFMLLKQNRLSWWNIESLPKYEFEQQLGKVREELCLLVEETVGENEQLVGDSSSPAISSSGVAPITNDDVFVGLDEDLITIKDRLRGESSKLQVIPIVGMGGIGKTTLARNAYNDQLIVECFHIRAWLTISQDFSAQRILSCLLDSMNLFLGEQVLGEECDEFLKAEKVYKTLKGRRYLIVMDDVWSTKVWDDLRKLFPDDGNGSRIMLTSRLSSVGVYADSSSPHQMQFIDKHQSWDLLKQKVFMAGQDCPSELEDVGKEIAERCGGLPLAVVLVGGILSAGKKTRASWEEIAQNMTTIVDKQLEIILSLSYKELPQHLRPCFLFIGGFPEDYLIHVSRLTKFWVAEGFLKPGILEDEAERYLEDLVKRNLVLVIRRKSNGKIKSCRLHDLVRDLCIKTAHQEKFLLDVTESFSLPEVIKDLRCVDLSYGYRTEIWGRTIRSMFSDKIATSLELELVRNFRLLRVLDMINNFRCRFLDSNAHKLFHLRYLAITLFENVTSSIKDLENLQTLIISRTNEFERSFAHYSSLPLEIWSMPQLRHLVFSYSYVLPDPPDGLIIPLENLHTLSGVASLVCSERILKLIPNVKKLGIIYFRNGNYNLHNLIHMRRLEKLKITRHQDTCWLRQNPIYPHSLKKLTLYGGKFPWKDMTVVGALPNLEVLKLLFLVYDGDTWETNDGDFLCLKFLLIEESNLEHWITEASHFPKLESLVLHLCWDLNQIPDCIGEIPTLELIEVDDANESLVDSAKQIQEDQLENYGNDALQVRCIHYKKAAYESFPWQFISSASVTTQPVFKMEWKDE